MLLFLLPIRLKALSNDSFWYDKQKGNVRVVVSNSYNNKNERIVYLEIDNYVWMSNTDDEYKDITRSVSIANGDCFVGGLGLGIIIRELLGNPLVSSIDIVEKNPDIIDVIGPLFKNERVNIINGDCRYPTDKLYSFVYFDYWLEPTREIFDELTSVVIPRFKKYLYKDGKIDYWLKPRLDSGDFWS